MANVVLVHGAYQGGWIWKYVSARLRALGHHVLAPSLDGCAERSAAMRPGITTEVHGQEVADLLVFEDLSDVLLVGTSSGGMVCASAAEKVKNRIARLVFVDAVVLPGGESFLGFLKRPPTPEGSISLSVTREDARSRLFADLDPDLRGWAAERVAPHPAPALRSPVALPNFWEQDWASSVVYCRRAKDPGERHLRGIADRLKSNWHEMDTGHYPMLSKPGELSKIILDG